MSLFTVKELTAGYGRKTVVDGVSFSLEQGCLLGLLGANGGGKTTLLKAICGILPHTGSCELDQTVLENLSPRQLAKLCSYIPQRSGVSIDISVLDVVLMGYNPQLNLLEHPTSAMREQARRMLGLVGLAGKEDMNYLHLSEGQKQMCILARTLCAGGRLLLLDEPESALDFRFRHRMLEIIGEWITRHDSAAIVSLHDPALALNYCDRLLLLSDGKVIGDIAPRTDSLETMEEMLGRIYGSVSLTRCVSRSGQTYLVMLKEQEDP